MMRVNDVHVRTFAGEVGTIGRQLETLASEQEDFWVTDLAPPMILDRGLQPGSRGGHGSVRYSVLEHSPGESVVFGFDPSIGLVGTHRFTVTQDGDQVRVRHELDAEASGSMRLLWKRLVLPLHSGVIEDIFDHLERASTGTARRQRPTSAPMRWLGRRMAAAGI
jgi:hypothetical protein